MKNHTKVYLKFFKYHYPEEVVCECCGNLCIDIHHISARGMGGSKLKDFIENLMGLCRTCHDEYGDKNQYREMLKEKHFYFMKYQRVLDF